MLCVCYISSYRVFRVTHNIINADIALQGFSVPNCTMPKGLFRVLYGLLSFIDFWTACCRDAFG